MVLVVSRPINDGGTKTRQVLRAIGAGAEYVMHHQCLVFLHADMSLIHLIIIHIRVSIGNYCGDSSSRVHAQISEKVTRRSSQPENARQSLVCSLPGLAVWTAEDEI